MKTRMRDNANTARMQFRISADLHQRLKKAAREGGTSMSAILRDMFERHAGKRTLKTA
jgi:predicted DNA-binding protein